MIHRFKKAVAFGLLVAAVSSLPAFAQTNDEPDQFTPPSEGFTEYSLGDQMLSINLGLMVPLFFNWGPEGFARTNLSVGGIGSLQWGSFINSRVALGMELAGTFMFTPNGRSLFMVPITGKVSYFFRPYPFEIPIFLGAGLNISRLDDQTKFDPILKPGASFYWAYNPEWSFGLNTVWWWVPQFYRGPEPPSGDTRVGNFLELSLSALYHF